MNRSTAALAGTTCLTMLVGCTVPPPPLTLDNVGAFDLCLCATAEPPRFDRGQCVGELTRRHLSCDEAEWSAYWARRR